MASITSKVPAMVPIDQRCDDTGPPSLSAVSKTSKPSGMSLPRMTPGCPAQVVMGPRQRYVPAQPPYVVFLPRIRFILVPQVGQVPCAARRPFASSTS